MNKFKVGDVVIGKTDFYGYSGQGSVNKVVEILTKDHILIECIWPTNSFASPHDRHRFWEVYSKDFIKLSS